jgi:hypothetical protein
MEMSEKQWYQLYLEDYCTKYKLGENMETVKTEGAGARAHHLAPSSSGWDTGCWSPRRVRTEPTQITVLHAQLGGVEGRQWRIWSIHWYTVRQMEM